MSSIYCVFNERLIARGNESHVRQLKEDEDGNRAPMFKDGRATIYIDNNKRYSVMNGDEILYIGTGIDEAIQRIYYAEPTAHIEVSLDNSRYTVEDYIAYITPLMFRIHHYNGKYGFLAAVDYIDKGKRSDVQLFETAEDVRAFIEQVARGNEYKIVYNARKIEEMDDVDDKSTYNRRQFDLEHLRQAVETKRREKEKAWIEGATP